MSVSSTSSNMSVSYCGSEMPLEEALDSCFLGLQEALNCMHCNVRQLAMLSEQDDDYLVGLDKVLEIHDGIEEMSELFKELKSVSKQVIGPAPRDLKDEAKKKIDDHKLMRKREKEREKEEQKLAAVNAAMSQSSLSR